MATQEELDTLASDVLAHDLAAQRSESARLRQTEIAQARFMYVASIALAIIYAGFLIYRVVDGNIFDPTSYFLVVLLIFGVVTTRRRFTAAKSDFSRR